MVLCQQAARVAVRLKIRRPRGAGCKKRHQKKSCRTGGAPSGGPCSQENHAPPERWGKKGKKDGSRTVSPPEQRQTREEPSPWRKGTQVGKKKKGEQPERGPAQKGRARAENSPKGGKKGEEKGSVGIPRNARIRKRTGKNGPSHYVRKKNSGKGETL